MTGTSGRQDDVVVVGGGLAGLTAACYLAREGAAVTVLEKSAGPGGRSATRELDGFLFNRGGHALYTGGATSRVLTELGVGYGYGVPVDGWQVLVDGLRGVAERSGVHVRSGAPAEAVEVAAGHAAGVRLRDGSTLPASAVGLGAAHWCATPRRPRWTWASPGGPSSRASAVLWRRSQCSGSPVPGAAPRPGGTAPPAVQAPPGRVRRHRPVAPRLPRTPRPPRNLLPKWRSRGRSLADLPGGG